MARQWCLSSVTLVHPTQTVKLFGHIFTRFCTLGIWGGDRANFHEDRSKGTPPPGALNTKGVGETGQSGRFVANLVNAAITCLPIYNKQ